MMCQATGEASELDHGIQMPAEAGESATSTYNLHGANVAKRIH